MKSFDLQAIDDGAWVWPLRTPTLPPASTTNTLLLGNEEIVVVEPATPHADEQERLVAELDARVAQGARVHAILITHHHIDHIGFAEGLRERTGAPLMAHPQTATRASLALDRELHGGETLALEGGFEVRVVFTPGHAPGHLLFHETKTGVAHGGDLVAGEGTILIDPEDGGDMAAYLGTLRAAANLGIRRLVPAHGPVIDDPKAKFAHYIEHRLAREAKVLAALDHRPRAFDDVLARAYEDTPKMLWPLAARSLEAHLGKLDGEGRIVRVGTTIALTPSPN